MSEKIEISHSSDVREKAAAAFGLDQPSDLDLVSRGNYASEEAYLDAAVKAELERSSPEYQSIRRRLSAEYRQRQEKAERERQAEQYREIRAGVELAPVDVREIDTQAAEFARRDLASGKIMASDLGEAISRYAADLTEKRKGVLASNAMMNAEIRKVRSNLF